MTHLDLLTNRNYWLLFSFLVLNRYYDYWKGRNRMVTWRTTISKFSPRTGFPYYVENFTNSTICKMQKAQVRVVKIRHKRPHHRAICHQYSRFCRRLQWRVAVRNFCLLEFQQTPLFRVLSFLVLPERRNKNNDHWNEYHSASAGTSTRPTKTWTKNMKNSNSARNCEVSVRERDKLTHDTRRLLPWYEYFNRGLKNAPSFYAFKSLQQLISNSVYLV